MLVLLLLRIGRHLRGKVWLMRACARLPCALLLLLLLTFPVKLLLLLLLLLLSDGLSMRLRLRAWRAAGGRGRRIRAIDDDRGGIGGLWDTLRCAPV